MLELATLARPYARAAHELARDEGALEDWNRRLELASAIISDPDVRRLTRDPRLSREDLVSAFADIGGEQFDSKFRGFLRVLAVYHRLDLLPEVTAQFEQLRHASEQSLAVKVTSAVEMDEEQKEKLAASLARRFGREVELEAEVDPAVIGGAIIRAGDQVIDGSVRGRLERLTRQVAH